jgi:hypothetical protein
MNRRPALSNNNESNFKRLKTSLKQTRFSPEANVRNFTRNSIVGTQSNTTRPSNRRVNTLRNRNRNPGAGVRFSNGTQRWGNVRSHNQNYARKSAALIAETIGTYPSYLSAARKKAMNLSNELAKSNNIPESSGGRRRTRKALRH